MECFQGASLCGWHFSEIKEILTSKWIYNNKILIIFILKSFSVFIPKIQTDNSITKKKPLCYKSKIKHP